MKNGSTVLKTVLLVEAFLLFAIGLYYINAYIKMPSVQKLQSSDIVELKLSYAENDGYTRKTIDISNHTADVIEICRTISPVRTVTTEEELNIVRGDRMRRIIYVLCKERLFIIEHSEMAFDLMLVQTVELNELHTILAQNKSYLDADLYGRGDTFICAPFPEYRGALQRLMFIPR